MAVIIDMEYEGELHCRAEHGPSRTVLTTDAPVDNGGRGEAFSPTDLVATALGTCMLTIMGIAAGTLGVDIAGTRVTVAKEMVADPMRRIGVLRVQVVFPEGLRLSGKEQLQLERAAEACPVRRSLHPDVQIIVEFSYSK